MSIKVLSLAGTYDANQLYEMSRRDGKSSEIRMASIGLSWLVMDDTGVSYRGTQPVGAIMFLGRPTDVSKVIPQSGEHRQFKLLEVDLAGTTTR